MQKKIYQTIIEHWALPENLISALGNDEEWLIFEPIQEDITCFSEDWACYEQSDRYLEFIEGKFFYFACLSSIENIEIGSRELIIENIKVTDFNDQERNYLIFVSKVILSKLNQNDYRYNPILEALMLKLSANQNK